MGKSPGKWIKAVLFGKKSSKSYISKGVTSEKKPAAKAPISDIAVNHPVISNPLNQSIDRGGEKIELENDTNDKSLCDDVVFPSGNVSTDAELGLQAQAATKAQAAFRGYMARRAFRALKGIIRLQALIRGHLVRRQAVATLHCTLAIVRIQALARGKRARVSNSGPRILGKNSLGDHKDAKPADSSVLCISLRSEKLAANAFVRKLVDVMPRAMPLSLHYDVIEPNSAWNWLERWSLSLFSSPLSQPKKSPNNAKSQRKHWAQSVDTEFGQPKISARKVPTIPRKVTNHEIEPLQEQPQNEIERVKCNLRKVSATMAVASDRPEAEIRTVQSIPVKKPKSSAPEVHNQLAVYYSKQIVDSAIEAKEDQTNKENLRTRRRKSENISQKTQSLPGYMAATASAKAKLKAHGVPNSTEDGDDNGFTRRHSLPSSLKGKLHANGEGGNKMNKSLTSSRDGCAYLLKKNLRFEKKCATWLEEI